MWFASFCFLHITAGHGLIRNVFWCGSPYFCIDTLFFTYHYHCSERFWCLFGPFLSSTHHVRPTKCSERFLIWFALCWYQGNQHWVRNPFWCDSTQLVIHTSQQVMEWLGTFGTFLDLDRPMLVSMWPALCSELFLKWFAPFCFLHITAGHGLIRNVFRCASPYFCIDT